LVKSVHLEQNVLAWNKTFLPETKCSCLPHTACCVGTKILYTYIYTNFNIGLLGQTIAIKN
jgi:hypothetical protein